MWRKENPLKLLVGMQTSTATVENSVEIPLKTGNRTAINSVSSVSQLCTTLCDPMNCSIPGLPVHHQLLEFTQTHVHRVSDAIQPSHPLSSPSHPVPNPYQHQQLFQQVDSLHDSLMTQQSHSWSCTQRKPELKETRVPQCLS